MFTSFGAFVAQRLAVGAVDALERRLIWSGIGAVLMLAAMIFGLVAAYILLARQMDPFAAAGILAIACATLGALGFYMPKVIDAAEEALEEDQQKDPVTAIAETVEEEVEAAADYFGPVQVAVSGFMLGYSAARQLKSSAAQSAN